jgi:ectoine hydroxylase-related dioxygenase (phytanoyl-CoA dioxygenase family)
MSGCRRERLATKGQAGTPRSQGWRSERRDAARTAAECSGWSEKEGQVYVQPPVGVLEQLVAVRIHIDDCRADSGALRVVAKSHVEGRLNQERAEELRRKNGETAVPVARGDALVMRPLILHASSKATSLNPRRVLHFAFGPPMLPQSPPPADTKGLFLLPNRRIHRLLKRQLLQELRSIFP